MVWDVARHVVDDNHEEIPVATVEIQTDDAGVAGFDAGGHFAVVGPGVGPAGFVVDLAVDADLPALEVIREQVVPKRIALVDPVGEDVDIRFRELLGVGDRVGHGSARSVTRRGVGVGRVARVVEQPEHARVAGREGDGNEGDNQSHHQHFRPTVRPAVAGCFVAHFEKPSL